MDRLPRAHRRIFRSLGPVGLVAHEIRHLREKNVKSLSLRAVQSHLIHRPRHQHQPAIPLRLTDLIGSMPHSQPRVAARFAIRRISGDAETKEIRQPLLRRRQTFGRIHRTQQVIRRDPPIKRRGQATYPIESKFFRHLLLPRHALFSPSPRLPATPGGNFFPNFSRLAVLYMELSSHEPGSLCLPTMVR